MTFPQFHQVTVIRVRDGNGAFLGFVAGVKNLPLTLQGPSGAFYPYKVELSGTIKYAHHWASTHAAKQCALTLSEGYFRGFEVAVFAAAIETSGDERLKSENPDGNEKIIRPNDDPTPIH